MHRFDARDFGFTCACSIAIYFDMRERCRTRYARVSIAFERRAAPGMFRRRSRTRCWFLARYRAVSTTMTFSRRPARREASARHAIARGGVVLVRRFFCSDVTYQPPQQAKVRQRAAGESRQRARALRASFLLYSPGRAACRPRFTLSDDTTAPPFAMF